MKKKWVLLGMVLLGICCLLACSGKSGRGGTEDTRKKKESSADVSQFSEINGTTWQDSWVEKTASGVSVNVEVNAYTTIPDLKRMSVVEVEKYKLNKKNKKELLEGIFGKEIWYYEDDQKKAPKDFVKLEENDYKGTQYLGERDGVRYLFQCETSYEHGEHIYMSMRPCDEKDVAPNALKECVYVGRSPGSCAAAKKLENQCKISKEEAEKEAGDFLQKAGFPDMVRTGDGMLMWDGANENGEMAGRVCDGWYFDYSQGVEGAAFTDFGYDSGGVVMEFESSDSPGTVDPDSYYHKYSMECRSHICVTDQGVVEATWGNPIRTLSSVSGVKLLSFDTIKKSIRSQMTEYAEYCYQHRNKKAVTFSKMELVYRRVPDPDDEDKFTYVPAWRLRNASAVGDVVYFINAVDGSLITEWDIPWTEMNMFH